MFGSVQPIQGKDEKFVLQHANALQPDSVASAEKQMPIPIA